MTAQVGSNRQSQSLGRGLICRALWFLAAKKALAFALAHHHQSHDGDAIFFRCGRLNC